MRQADVAVVLPTCRGFVVPEQTVSVDWIIVHDQKKWEVTNGNLQRRSGTPQGHIAQEIVAPDPILYGEKTSAIRQAGLDAAYDAGYPYVLTVDDDCQLPVDWAIKHVEALYSRVDVCHNTVPGQTIRGLTLDHTMPVGISHGLWSGVLDYPAWYQFQQKPGLVKLEDRGWSKISFPFPMCGMNVGFRRECLPAVYFQHQFLRHDDIFAGWVAERILSLFDYGFLNGGAVVNHMRASDPEVNFVKEQPGDFVNKKFLDHVRGFKQTYMDPGNTFLFMCHHLENLRFGDREINTTFQRMVQDMFRWATRKETIQ